MSCPLCGNQYPLSGRCENRFVELLQAARMWEIFLIERLKIKTFDLNKSSYRYWKKQLKQVQEALRPFEDPLMPKIKTDSSMKPSEWRIEQDK